MLGLDTALGKRVLYRGEVLSGLEKEPLDDYCIRTAS